MQAFEFHFNPPGKNRSSLIFDSFCFEPQSAYEKRLGSLYLVGSLKNALPQHARFLNNLAEKIKEKYYRKSSYSPEKALKETLKESNEYLEEIAKKGDVSWLGNLSFVIISLFPRSKPWWSAELNLAKVGNFKIFLTRNGQIIDIDQRIKNLEEIEPYPLKVFSNIISGRLSENDTVAVLSQEVYQTFAKEKILEEIAEEPATKFVDTINSRKKELTKTSGVCLLLSLAKEKKESAKKTLEEKRVKEFSFKKMFQFFRGKRQSKKKKAEKSLAKITASGISLSSLPSFKKTSKKINKKTFSILILLLILFLGFLVFNREGEKKLENYLTEIEQIQEKIELIDGQETTEKAYREAWEEISLMKEIPPAASEDYSKLKNKIETELNRLNNLTNLAEPEPFFVFNQDKILPKKIIADNETIFCFSPDSQEITLITNNESRTLELDFQPQLATVTLNNLVFFFSQPKLISVYEKNNLISGLEIPSLPTDSQIIDFYSYATNLYFLESRSGQVFKYPTATELSWQDPQVWSVKECPKEESFTPSLCQKNTATDIKSMAVDSSIWILTENNTIERYYAGVFQGKISLDIFPEIEQLTKIYSSANLPYLYLLEPAKKRIIILDQSGELVKQYQSDKFNQIIDFTVNQESGEIYLLNGSEIYRLPIVEE